MNEITLYWLGIAVLLLIISLELYGYYNWRDESKYVMSGMSKYITCASLVALDERGNC